MDNAILFFNISETTYVTKRITTDVIFTKVFILKDRISHGDCFSDYLSCACNFVQKLTVPVTIAHQSCVWKSSLPGKKIS